MDDKKGTQKIFNQMMNDLAEISGYSELEHIPSSCRSFGNGYLSVELAAWNPERTLAVIFDAMTSY